ncbi:hypothetical protein [Arthrobacter alpinus]|uniref:hypothetical protein n=1 Tax=Arthrobacter alpinus TaxID=656366 RepID=UPI0011147A81|nr:hypothetical protein [Arthrobacter alpinus]
MFKKLMSGPLTWNTAAMVSVLAVIVTWFLKSMVTGAVTTKWAPVSPTVVKVVVDIQVLVVATGLMLPAKPSATVIKIESFDRFSALDSSKAARSVQVPAAVAQAPSPTLASRALTDASKELTVKV